MKKKFFKYLLFFTISLILLIVFNDFRYDTVLNFGFSSSIVNGEIPYKDLNIIITPLYHFIMSIGLIIKNTFLIYLIEQSILLTVFYYILNKLLKDKTVLVLYIMSFAYLDFIFPNYNFFIVFLLSILILFEKEKKSDYLIGLILGLLVLTKHNMGIIIYLISIILPMAIKKSIRRTITFVIPIIIFIIYLLINNTFYNFIDLSILGLNDFMTNSSYDAYIIPVIILLLINIYIIIKNPKKKINYYLIATYFFVFPICNRFHAIYCLISNIIIILAVNDIKINFFKTKLFKIIISELIILNIAIYIPEKLSITTNFTIIRDNPLEGYVITKGRLISINNIRDKYNSYPKVKMISGDNMLLNLYTKKKLTYLDMSLHGNFGKNGIERMIESIKNDKGTYYFIDRRDEYSYQFAYELTDYVKNNYTKIDEVEYFDIYYIP